MRAQREVANAVVVPVTEDERRSLLRAARSMARLRWVYVGVGATWTLALAVRAARGDLTIFESPRALAGLGVVALTAVGALSLQLASRSFTQGAPYRDESRLAEGLTQLYVHRVFALVALVVVVGMATASATGAFL